MSCSVGDVNSDWCASARETLEKWWENNIHQTLKTRMMKLMNALNTSGLNYLSKHLSKAYCCFYDEYMSANVTGKYLLLINGSYGIGLGNPGSATGVEWDLFRLKGPFRLRRTPHCTCLIFLWGISHWILFALSVVERGATKG